MTFTRTHTVTTFANPHLNCDECGIQVHAMRTDTNANVPCGHLGVTSICPSWGPVDGCACAEPCGLDSLTSNTTERTIDG